MNFFILMSDASNVSFIKYKPQPYRPNYIPSHFVVDPSLEYLSWLCNCEYLGTQLSCYLQSQARLRGPEDGRGGKFFFFTLRPYQQVFYGYSEFYRSLESGSEP